MCCASVAGDPWRYSTALRRSTDGEAYVWRAVWPVVLYHWSGGIVSSGYHYQIVTAFCERYIYTHGHLLLISWVKLEHLLSLALAVLPSFAAVDLIVLSVSGAWKKNQIKKRNEERERIVAIYAGKVGLFTLHKLCCMDGCIMSDFMTVFITRSDSTSISCSWFSFMLFFFMLRWLPLILCPSVRYED